MKVVVSVNGRAITLSFTQYCKAYRGWDKYGFDHRIVAVDFMASARA